MFSQVYSENSKEKVDKKNAKNIQFAEERNRCMFKVADEAGETERLSFKERPVQLKKNKHFA